MALRKKIMTVYGVEAEYWKISGLNHLNPTGDSYSCIQVAIDGYLSKDKKDEGVEKMATYYRSYDVPKADIKNKDIIKYLYEKIVSPTDGQENEFEGAEEW